LGGVEVIALLRTVVLLAGCGATACFAADSPIVGDWELVYVAPTDVANTIPNGVTNTKLRFTEDGHLLSMLPDHSSLTDARSTSYSFDGKHLLVQSRAMDVSFPDRDTMVLAQKFESQRTFKRIASFEQKLEPESLQLIATQASTAPISYDTRDYSALPAAERLRGTWEVLAYENVPRSQVPPYGFFNDIWTITADQVTVSMRQSPNRESVPFSMASGRLASSAIGLGGGKGSRVEWTPHFDEWGHLVLDSPYCRIVLKLLTKDTASEPAIPTKVVLLRTKP
jgi:hypothetical protein